MMEAFKIENINLSYGEKHVLKNVSIDLYKNQVTAFIGPSGCGKSTLLRCLNRMNDLIENCQITGSIKYNDCDINSINPMELRTNVGMVFQNPNPFPMSIFDNIAYGPRCHGIKNKAKLNEIVVDALKKAAIYDEVKDIDWTIENISTAINNTKEKANVKGKMLYMPIRIKSTGIMHGPELDKTLYLLGKDKVLNNLTK